METVIYKLKVRIDTTIILMMMVVVMVAMMMMMMMEIHKCEAHCV